MSWRGTQDKRSELVPQGNCPNTATNYSAGQMSSRPTISIEELVASVANIVVIAGCGGSRIYPGSLVEYVQAYRPGDRSHV